MLNTPKELLPLMVFKNTWWNTLDKGYVILLSAERDVKTNMYYWDIAFSHFGDGCKIMKWLEWEIKKCEYLGSIKEVFPKGIQENVKK